ncbi:unnamed protein product, partial [Didymodactylos carnosus]
LNDNARLYDSLHLNSGGIAGLANFNGKVLVHRAASKERNRVKLL